jgi:branched-chain amino acid transport system ATP-binding protein
VGTILKIENVTMMFGGLAALKGVCVDLEQGELLSIIGPNGSGKTTLFNVVTGIYSPTSGRVSFMGVPITGKRPYQIAAMGVARTFQNIILFVSLSVLNYVIVGQHVATRSGLLDAITRSSRFRKEEDGARDKAVELLDFVGLGSKMNELSRNLPYGEQKRLEIARALAAEPRLILLDEPTAGLNPREKAAVSDLIRAVHERGITVILIEHDMRVVMGISQRIVVLDHGERIAAGTPDEVKADARVIEAYLGKQPAVKS